MLDKTLKALDVMSLQPPCPLSTLSLLAGVLQLPSRQEEAAACSSRTAGLPVPGPPGMWPVKVFYSLVQIEWAPISIRIYLGQCSMHTFPPASLVYHSEVMPPVAGPVLDLLHPDCCFLPLFAYPQVVAYMEQQTQQEVAAALQEQQDRHTEFLAVKKADNACIQDRADDLKAQLANKLQALQETKVCQLFECLYA